ncbi:Ent-kaurenoic acid oxidase 2 [Linum grandiflorum]
MILPWWILCSTLLALACWRWNDLRYAVPAKFRLIGTGKKLPPGHMGLPFIGELISFLWYFKFLRRPDDFINSKRNKYGDGVGLYRTYLLGQPSIIACSAESSRFVLQSDDAFCLQRWPTNDLVGHHSLSAALGPSHKRLRNFVSVAVNQPNALRRSALLSQPIIAASLRSWADRGTVTVHTEARKMTFESIGKLFVSFEPGPVMEELDLYFGGMMKGMRATPIDLPGTPFRHALKCRKRLEAVFRGELEKRKQQKKRNLEEEEEEAKDLMDGLMRVRDENGDLLSDEEVVDNIASLVVGGYDSTALSSMWAVYCLAKYPDVLSKLREENMVLKKEKSDGEFITYDDISRLKYTKKVVEEVVRMANVAVFAFRLSDRDVEFQGHIIPKGWKVLCWLRYVHTDSRNFEDPLCFNPDRYDQGAGGVKPSGFQVFGAGTRICVANMFARTQLAIFLHHLSTGYQWELVNPNAGMDYLPHQRPADGVEISITKL